MQLRSSFLVVPSIMMLLSGCSRDSLKSEHLSRAAAANAIKQTESMRKTLYHDLDSRGHAQVLVSDLQQKGESLLSNNCWKGISQFEEHSRAGILTKGKTETSYLAFNAVKTMDCFAVPTAAWASKVTVVGNPKDPLNYNIPVIAVRELEQVTGVSEQGAEAEVPFTWRWTLNDIGQKLKNAAIDMSGTVDTSNRSATAYFRRYDDGWRLENFGLSGF